MKGLAKETRHGSLTELDDKAYQIAEFRGAATAKGYKLIRVRTNGKVPVSAGWQHGDDQRSLTNVTPDALNTGLLLQGLRVIDIDCDDPAIVGDIVRCAKANLPWGGLVRGRRGSPRIAILYRAATGEPGKRTVAGSNCKVEVLGAGQQLVVHGDHTSGAALVWARNRSPATVAPQDLTAVDEVAIERFLSDCASIFGVSVSSPTAFAQAPSSHFPANENHLSEICGGIHRAHWFDLLSPEGKRECVRQSLEVLDNRAADSRERWLSVLFATHDAENRGCPDARGLALTWSKRGAGWTAEVDFDIAWDSFRQGGGVTVGTLLRFAQDSGLDLNVWREPLAQLTPTNTVAVAGRPKAITVAGVPAVPAKRRWLHGTDVARGAVTLVVAPGARGKSSWLLGLALACASGRSLLGAHVFGGPLRVLYLNVEDATSELGLRLRAAMQLHGLKDAELSGLSMAGADLLRPTLLCTDKTQPRINPKGWQELYGEIDAVQPDLVIIDPLVALVGGVSINDNSAAALLMGELVGAAAKRDIAVVIAHHAAKGRDASSAEAAMGAASLVNLSRICLSLEPLAVAKALEVGVAPWEAPAIFRIIGTKQNLSPPTATDRWFRLVSVEMYNAEPPVYPNGDRVAVVERFTPASPSNVFPPAMLKAALSAVDQARPPLSPNGRSATSTLKVLAGVIAPHRNGFVSESDAKAVLDHLLRTGLLIESDVLVPRPGRGAYARKGLTLTSAGMAFENANSPQPP